MGRSAQGDGWCYDPQSRCQSKDRVPYYYVGLPENILREICEAGFEILKSEVREGEDRTGKPFVRGELVVDARRFGLAAYPGGIRTQDILRDGTCLC